MEPKEQVLGSGCGPARRTRLAQGQGAADLKADASAAGPPFSLQNYVQHGAQGMYPQADCHMSLVSRLSSMETTSMRLYPPKRFSMRSAAQAFAHKSAAPGLVPGGYGVPDPVQNND